MSAWLNRVLRRRAFLRGTILLPMGLVIAACDDAAPEAATPNVSATGAPVETATGAATASPAVTPATSPVTLEPTPACGDDDDDPTPAQTEGPYFTPNSPERANLREPGMLGTPLTIEGFVLSTGCAPVARALIDFWQCDAAGVYDNAGYTLRGHQFTDALGRWRLETILPGVYPGRTRHIHLKVQAAGHPVLTTQVYFEGEPGNATDRIFDPRLVLRDWVQDATGASGRFDFVLEV